MKKIKILSYIIIYVIALLPSYLFSDTYHPVKARQIVVSLLNPTEDAYYVDILVDIDHNDKVFTKFNKSNAEKNGFSDNDSYCNYSSDGYISYSLHFKNADSSMQIIKNNHDISNQTFVSYRPDKLDMDKNYYLLKEFSPKIKIAVLNKDKKVIKVSDSGYIYKGRGYLAQKSDNEGCIKYEYEKNDLEIDYNDPISVERIVRTLIISLIMFLIALCIIHIVYRFLHTKHI